jgi:polyisoprenoid-binding protein YceI
MSNNPEELPLSRNLRIIIGLIVIMAVVAVVAFLYATRPLEKPSEDVQDNTQQLSANAFLTETAATAQAAVAAAEQTVQASSTEIATEAVSGNGEESSTDNPSVVVYRISQDDSQVEFNVDEVLSGRDNTVIGVSNQVAGDILVNLDDPSTSQVGQIRINARTFATDSGRRDSSIGRFILQSEKDEFEFIEFQPTSLSGLPESVAVGDTVSFQITGDLSIAGTTNSVTFDATATLASEDQLTGHAETTILFPDFNLTIPSVPAVSHVDEDVILKIDFVANRVVEG